MAGINKVIILGNLGKDPEVRTMPNGSTVANITIATSESWTDKNTQERKEQTEWHRVVFYRRQAEVVGEYLRKGSKVYIEGRLRTRKWQDQNGQERYTTEIQADVLQMLDGRNEGSYIKPHTTAPQHSQAQAAPQGRPTQAAQQWDGYVPEDDIPF